VAQQRIEADGEAKPLHKAFSLISVDNRKITDVQ
jgi:hypothetical protein